MRTELGKIKNVRFGYGGYQDAMFGVSFELGGNAWGVCDFQGAWSIDIECSDHCKWTEEDRNKQYAETTRYINQLLRDAKKREINELNGVPIEVTFEGMTLKSWCILTDVL